MFQRFYLSWWDCPQHLSNSEYDSNVILQVSVPLGVWGDCCHASIFLVSQILDRLEAWGCLGWNCPVGKNCFHQHICDTEQSYVKQWPCKVIARQSSYFSLLCNTLSPQTLFIELQFYCFYSKHLLWAYFDLTLQCICYTKRLVMEKKNNKESLCYLNVAIQ